jgi:outer membrane protein W
MFHRNLFLLILTAALPAAALSAQGVLQNQWTFRTSALISGQSHGSEPTGYTMYSGISLGAAISRRFSQVVSLELGIRTESREVDQASASGPDQRLGSLEMLPLTLLVQVQPNLPSSLRPYVGAGAALTVGWEKSGALDNLDVSPAVGPALQVGVDWILSPGVLLNFDAKWNGMSTDLGSGGMRMATFHVDPMTLGFGVGFRF